MSDEVQNSDEPGDGELDLPEDDYAPDPMVHWERGLAVLIGLAAGVPGVFAVFDSSNQAGTAVLLIAAVAFLLIGVQGTPLIKLASGQNSVEMTQRRIGKKLLGKARSTDNPVEKDAYADAAVIAAPNLEDNPVIKAVQYEKKILNIFRAAMPNGYTPVTIGRSRDPVDIVMTRDDKRVAVAVKYRHRGSFTMDDIRQLQSQVQQQFESDIPTLVITNAPLAKPIEEFNRLISELDHPSMEVVRWTDFSDNDLLVRAFGRLTR